MNKTLQSMMTSVADPYGHDDSFPSQLRSEEKFCDAVIKVGDATFPVHKVIMCFCSTYFSTLFLSPSNIKCTDFIFEGVSPEIICQIIDFAYTGSAAHTNTFELMITANYFKITSLVQTCFDILKDQLCPENCIGLWKLTETNHFPELEDAAFHFICGHFEEVVLCEEFLQLSMQELAEILGCDELNVSQEVTVYESVLRWINHRPEERQRSISTLLPKVRLELIDQDYIILNVCTNDLVMENRRSNLLVQKAIKVISQLMTFDDCQSRNLLVRPRLPNAVLLAVGGRTDKSFKTNPVEAFDYSHNCWVKVPKCKPVCPLAYHATVFLDGYVYIIGSVAGAEFSSCVYRFDPVAQNWQEVSPMHKPRCNFSITVLNGCIYAMGGNNRITIFRSSEYYRPDTNQWTLTAFMNEQRNNASCTTMNNKIYICGGHNGIRDLETAECYNPDTNQWTLIAPMGSRRSGLGVIAYADHIFAVGGSEGEVWLSSAEAYNPLTNTWHNVPEMNQSRIDFGIVVINKRLFVVGGYKTNKVESYDSTTNSWSEVPNMKFSRRSVSCCVMSGLCNMAEYCARRATTSTLKKNSKRKRK